MCGFAIEQQAQPVGMAERGGVAGGFEFGEGLRHAGKSEPYAFYYAVAIAYLAARRFEQAIEWADRALHEQPRLVSQTRVKVVAYAHLGRLDAACAELGRVLAIDPKLTIAGFRDLAHYLAPEVLELYVAGLRLAGLPEGDGA